jgi:hypothetical protein
MAGFCAVRMHRLLPSGNPLRLPEHPQDSPDGPLAFLSLAVFSFLAIVDLSVHREGIYVGDVCWHASLGENAPFFVSDVALKATYVFGRYQDVSSRWSNQVFHMHLQPCSAPDKEANARRFLQEIVNIKNSNNINQYC